MEHILVTTGVHYVNIPEHGLTFLCGCPADVTKHLIQKGLISEKTLNGVTFQTGPNAILLSDLPIQNGSFANLAEFPVLQMFYNQGRIITGHPNNDGSKPLIVGNSQRLNALAEYIYRGTYGLANEGEIIQAGVSPAFAKEIVREKLWFAQGNLRKSEDLLELCPLDGESVEARPGLIITRKKVNVFTFKTAQQTITVDLNLGPGEFYQPPIRLGYTKIERAYFSVIHIGEGDGWDQTRPCMSSILQFQGKLYLIDTGPNILASLTALGIGVNEIEGIFQTHGHDDHFAGLPSLARTDHKIKYYSTKLVRSCVMKKMAALMSLPERNFQETFEFHDLKFGDWNDVEGLMVMPVFSPHPVETNIFFFRAPWAEGYKSYSHLADIASFKVLKSLLVDDKNSTDSSRRMYESFTKIVTATTDLKKIDIGGGAIHGNAFDFSQDQSSKIILSHTSRSLTVLEKDVGTESTFGIEDILIPAQSDYAIRQAHTYLKAYYPGSPEWELEMLLNCPLTTMSMGTVMQRKGTMFSSAYLVVSGVVEAVDSSRKGEILLSGGTMIGEYNILTGELSQLTWRAKSFVTVLEIPLAMFLTFIRRNTNLDEVKRVARNTNYLQTTSLFGESVSSLRQTELARACVELSFEPKEIAESKIDFTEDPCLLLVKEGCLILRFEDHNIDTVEAGDFCGEESLFLRGSGIITIEAEKNTQVLVIPGDLVRSIPIVEWKILETYERRLASIARH